MTYYSALHYAAKAEKSANLAEQYATQATQFSGKVIQIGFDGFMENGRLVFKHSPAGVDIPYDLLDDHEYEIDMAYSGTDLANDVELVVKNGADTINFVSALHRDSTTPVTVKDMKSVMRYDERTGYRWLFKAAFKITPSGNKVLLLYPVISVGGSGTGRNIGDIFYTSRLDNELSGAVDADGATYSVEAFTGEQSVPELLRKGSLPFVSMSEYESIVSANGSCRAWGWDNGDTFRVPTVKALLLTKKQASVVGNGMSLGLTDGTSYFGLKTIDHVTSFVGAHTSSYGASIGEKASGSWTNTGSHYNTGVTTDPEKSGVVANLDVIEYRAMVQLSTGVKEDATQLKEYKFNNPHFFGESKWTDVDPKNGSWLISNGNFHSGATYTDMYKQLQVELNASLNVGDTVEIDGRTFVKRGLPVKLSTDEYTDYDFVVNTSDTTFRLPLLNGSEDLPSDRYEDLTLTSTTQRFTAPANGIYTVSGIGLGWVDVINETSGGFGFCAQPRTSDGFGRYTVKAKRNDQIVIFCGAIPSSYKCIFVYATGNSSLYFYVGDTLQDASLINAGGVLDYFSKLNTVHCVVETFKSGFSWYRVYDDGWVEQGGQIVGSLNTITFLKNFKDTNYNFQASVSDDTPENYAMTVASWNDKTQYGVTVYMGYNGTTQEKSPCDWQACGYGA